MEGDTKVKKINPSLIIFIVLVVGGALLAFNIFGSKKFSSENVTIKSVDLTQAIEEARLPVGFLKDIPVELGNITESNTLNYPDRKVVLYSLSYTSIKSTTKLLNIYTKFFKANKYKVTEAKKLTNGMVYSAAKDKSDINIMITLQPTNRLIQVSYVVRQ